MLENCSNVDFTYISPFSDLDLEIKVTEPSPEDAQMFDVYVYQISGKNT